MSAPSRFTRRKSARRNASVDPTTAVITVNNSATGAVYKGLALGFNESGAFLFATNFKAGMQQSNTDATNLSQSLYSLAEVDYVARPPGLAEGNYRLWVRNDNSSQRARRGGGISFDQKLTNVFGLFGRYGVADKTGGRDRFYSGGFQVQHGAVFSPQDFWGLGYAETQLKSGDRERLGEWYYNFLISDKLRLSFSMVDEAVIAPGIERLASLVG